MFEPMNWKSIYELWKMGRIQFPELLSSPVSAETVFVEYKQDGYIYGYDWLENTEASKRKQLIKKAPTQFLYFTQPTNKGTIQTAEMLVDAQNEEELAAIWIAATARELAAFRIGNGIGLCADMLYFSACGFLKTRYYLWHHAMKRLVPKILIPSSVLENMTCKDTEPMIGLIQMNTVLLKNTWSILRYTSLENEEPPEFSCRIDPE